MIFAIAYRMTAGFRRPHIKDATASLRLKARGLRISDKGSLKHDSNLSCPRIRSLVSKDIKIRPEHRSGVTDRQALSSSAASVPIGPAGCSERRRKPTIKCRLPICKVKIHSDTFSLRSTLTSLRNFSLSGMRHDDPQYFRLDDLPFTANAAPACVNDWLSVCLLKPAERKSG
jgi:hypothetical protein